MAKIDFPLHAGIFDYWGKARPAEGGPNFHLLPYHCLDVAAVGRRYLQCHPALLAWLGEQLGITDGDAICDWVAFWLSLHDIGKFSITFQGQRVDLVSQLQGCAPGGILSGVRHDSLGMHLWSKKIELIAQDNAWFGADPDVFDGISCWVRAVTGHHGQPPLNKVDRLLSPHHDNGKDDVQFHFRQRDAVAAQGFAQAVRDLLLTPQAAAIPSAVDAVAFERISRELSWWMAGLAVLADWVGSNADIFRYRDTPDMALQDYWLEAQRLANIALSKSGLMPVERQVYRPFSELFPAIRTPSPLQNWAATVEIMPGPQVHLLEDVTGAGKTEAAVALTHRLMASGCADGFFIALPTMATANAMYGRIACMYDLLFGRPANLTLAHGKRLLVEDFSASVIEPGGDENDASQIDESATRRCSRWLADQNKRALLAPAGVGTIDQALMGALQCKHQSIRLLGLVRKVLVIDEVHACDSYMLRTLELLLEFHARAGGSAILLSATLTQHMKSKLLNAFAKGCKQRATTLKAVAYPMATSWFSAKPDAVPEAVVESAIATRPDVRRTVTVRYETDRVSVIQGIVAALAQGKCVAWIRNTVGDVLEARAALVAHVPAERITVFHARFTMGDRLDTEHEVLRTFGPESGPAERAGRLLIASQVAEQSLDVDFDLVVSDLAPIDRLIQRAGRLRRHVRDADGRRLLEPGTTDQRGEPCLWVLGPLWTDAPDASWFKRFSFKSSSVYGHHGQLWLTAKVLQTGQFTMPDDARFLIESVFGDESEIPAGLTVNATQAEGKAYGDASTADQNSVTLANGYARNATEWTPDTVAPSRLGEDTLDVLLARWDGDQLKPWRDDKPAKHAWAYSTVRVAKRLISDAVQDSNPLRAALIQAEKDKLPGGGRWVVMLCMEQVGGRFSAAAVSRDKYGAMNQSVWRYDRDEGLVKQ